MWNASYNGHARSGVDTERTYHMSHAYTRKTIPFDCFACVRYAPKLTMPSTHPIRIIQITFLARSTANQRIKRAFVRSIGCHVSVIILIVVQSNSLLLSWIQWPLVTALRWKLLLVDVAQVKTAHIPIANRSAPGIQQQDRFEWPVIFGKTVS